MNRSVLCAVATTVLFASVGRADFVEFSYHFTAIDPASQATLTTLASDTSHGTEPSRIRLMSEPGNPRAVSSDVVTVAYTVESSAPKTSPDLFTDHGPGGKSSGAFVLRLNVLDIESGRSLSQPLDFHGRFHGTVSSLSSNLRIAWDEDYSISSPRSFLLGKNRFSVWFENYSSPPTPNRSTLPGSTTFHIDAQAAVVNQVPEPTSLTLGFVGLSVLGLAAWRRHRRASGFYSTIHFGGAGRLPPTLTLPHKGGGDRRGEPCFVPSPLVGEG